MLHMLVVAVDQEIVELVELVELVVVELVVQYLQGQDQDVQ